ncbi:hypothetical protein OJ997_18165 [Solirubrobacter phytolaccae]|uniref:Autotransporter-associated beta strand repeat-containing protein n=1 Tax=Solirubrobacter phytolaccae TaxID=1404360 RepID=A0A9X3SGA5_9ACTN|nr:hypothetical protein [Solirubrobacter phytolaccae]MDA0182237.1 hypothetical protein [Solirubrobacter phytolaccae]
MKRRIALLTAAFLAAGGGTAMAADITYTGPNGAWTTASSWSGGSVPGSGDTAIIPNGKQVTLDTAATVARLDLAGTLLGAGELTMGSGTWSGGTMGGSGTTRVTGTLTHTANTALEGTRTLVIAGTLDMVGAGRYINRGSGTPLVRNTGTIKRGVAGTVEIYTAVENDGTIQGVELEAGGSGSTGTFDGVNLHSGTFELENGAKLTNTTLDGGTVNVTGTVTASGAMSAGAVGGAGTFHVNGPLEWSGGSMGGTGTTRVTSTMTHTANTSLTDTRTLQVEGTLDMAGDGRYINRSGTPLIKNTGTIKRTAATGNVELYPAVENDGSIQGVELEGGGSGSTGEFVGGQLHGGTFELENGAKLTGVALNGGTVNATGTVTGSGATTMSASTLGGTGTFVFGGTFAWSGGTMTGAGITRITGTMTHSASTSLAAGRVLAVEGTLDMAGDGRAINGSGGAAIHVTGTFKRTGTGANATTAAVDNDGLVKDIELGGGGKDTSTGEFSGGNLKAGTIELGTGAKLTGDTLISGATVNGPVTVVAARMTGGTLGGTPDITGTLEWTGGKMAGVGTTKVATGATLILNGIASLTTGRVLENRGLIDVRGTATIFDDFDAPAERIENLGTLRKTAGTSSTIGAPLHNVGTVDGKVGELRLETGTTEPDTGTFTGTDATNRVVFVGARTFTGAVALPGTVEIADNVTVKAGDTLTLAGTAVHRAGALTGNLTVTGRLTWDGGRQNGPGTTTVTPAGRIVITPTAAFGCGSGSMDDGRVLVNQGLLRLEKGADLGTFEDTRITNSGRIELDTPNDDSCGSSSGIHGDAVLLNTGTVAKTGGTSPSHLRLVVDNDGTINGPLELESAETVTHTGAFKDITLGEGVLVVDTGATLTGTTEVADGELRVLRPVTVASLKQTGGLITGTGALTVTGQLTWSDGDQVGPGATVIAAGATALVNDNVHLDGDRELRNAGTLTVDDAIVFMERGASIRNTGTFVLDGAAQLDDSAFQYGYGEAGLVHNTGTLRKTGTGSAVGEATLDNDGVIEILDGRLELPELLNWSGPLFGGAGTLAGGTFVVGNGAALLLPGSVKANAARLVLNAGSQVLYNEFTGSGIEAKDGLTALLRNAAGGTLELAGGRSVTVAGTFANQGVLALGAGSTLNAGGFTQAAGAVLRPTVTAASSGRVSVTGSAQLGGRLDVVAPAPVNGDVPVVTGVVAGTFAAVTGAYVPTYAAGGVTVRRAGGEGPKTAAVVEAPAPTAALATPAFVAPAKTPAATKPAVKSKPKATKKKPASKRKPKAKAKRARR